VAARPVLEVVAASLRRSVQQLPGAVQHVCTTVVARVAVVDDPVLEREGTQAVQLLLPDVEVCSPWRAEVEPGARSSLLFGEHGEVDVEVASKRRDPREAPAHSALVGAQLLERRARHGDERHVAVVEVDDGTVDVIRHERAAWAGFGVFRSEHEMEDEQLRAPVEQLSQCLRSLLGLEAVGLLDGHPRQLPALARELVAAASQLLLPLEQLGPGGKPLLARSDPVLCHR
jgi:hypothetical protein